MPDPTNRPGVPHPAAPRRTELNRSPTHPVAQQNWCSGVGARWARFGHGAALAGCLTVVALDIPRLQVAVEDAEEAVAAGPASTGETASITRHRNFGLGISPSDRCDNSDTAADLLIPAATLG